MREVTIIGAGVAGRACVEAMRRRKLESAVTIIDKKDFSFAPKDLIACPTDLSRGIELAPWARDKNVNFIKARVERINPKRRRIYFKEGESSEYDTLIVATGLLSRKLPISGERREGFFYLSQLDPYALRDMIKIYQEALVQVSSWLGLQLAWTLRSLNMEVRILAPSFDFLGGHKNRVLEALAGKSIIVQEAAQVEEVLGEGSIKAAKLSPLKIVSAQVVCIDSGFEAGCDFFEEEIRLEDSVYTNIEDVFFLGDVTRKGISSQVHFIYNHQEAIRQAQEFVDAFMSGKRLSFQLREPDADAIRQAYGMILNDTSVDAAESIQ